MDYEKKYKEALERAKELVGKWVGKNKDFYIEDYSYIFPELKESEDDRIRKELIKGFKFYEEDCKWVDSLTTKEILAWFEKQGKEMSDPRYSILDKLIEADNIYQMSVNDAMVEEARHKAIEALSKLEISKLLEFEKQGKQESSLGAFKSEDDVRRMSTIQVLEYARSLDAYNQYGKESINKNIAWLKKQGKQESADEVKPKFQVGDWIINNDKRIAVPTQILKIEKYGYVTSMGYVSFDKVKTDYHLWIIQDAKDGDVLCTYEFDEPKIIFILKGTPKKPYTLSFICYYNIFYSYFESNSERVCLAPLEVKPATKEQRDTLFEKIKKAGYEWNPDKLELKKLA